LRRHGHRAFVGAGASDLAVSAERAEPTSGVAPRNAPHARHATPPSARQAVAQFGQMIAAAWAGLAGTLDGLAEEDGVDGV
jgi:hypothetical protein